MLILLKKNLERKKIFIGGGHEGVKLRSHLIGDDQTNGAGILVGADGTTNWTKTPGGSNVGVVLEPTLNNHYHFELTGSTTIWNADNNLWTGERNVVFASVNKKNGGTAGNIIIFDTRNTGTGAYNLVISGGIDNAGAVNNAYYYTDSGGTNQSVLNTISGEDVLQYKVRIWVFDSVNGVKFYLNGGTPKYTGGNIFTNAPARFVMGLSPSNFFSNMLMESYIYTYPIGGNFPVSTLNSICQSLGTKYGISVSAITS